MNGESESQDKLIVEEDEELMSDFKDLFPDEDEGVSGELTANERDDSLDELDAFLDDFEQKLDIPDKLPADEGGDQGAAPVAGDEPAPVAEEEELLTDSFDELQSELEIDDDTMPASEQEAEATASLTAGEGDALELDKDELDLDVGQDEAGMEAAEAAEDDEASPVEQEEAVAEDKAEDVTAEGEAPTGEQTGEEDSGRGDDVSPQSEPAPEEASEEPVAPQTAATAAVQSQVEPAASVAAPAPALPAAGTVIAPPAPVLSKAQLIGGGLVLTAALLLSVAAVWMGMALGTQIDTLNENMSELQQRVLKQSRRGTIDTQAQLSEQLNRLGMRVNELAVIVEGPVSHLRESNQQALEQLARRLDELEAAKAVSSPEPSKSQSRPLVNKDAAGDKKAATPAAAVQPGWVINLLSVSSAKAADKELAQLRKQGIEADTQRVVKEGKSWYRLRVTGFDSYDAAKAYIKTVEKQTGFKSAWVAQE